jgi:hypothetical protein
MRLLLALTAGLLTMACQPPITMPDPTIWITVRRIDCSNGQNVAPDYEVPAKPPDQETCVLPAPVLGWHSQYNTPLCQKVTDMTPRVWIFCMVRD